MADTPTPDSLEENPELNTESKTVPTSKPKRSTGKKRPEAKVTFAEFVAMGEVPGKHAIPLKFYVGDVSERPISEWRSLYEEMMTKPTGTSQEDWHEQFQGKNSK